jgi:ferritin-like metal-binding protein YciE
MARTNRSTNSKKRNQSNRSSNRSSRESNVEADGSELHELFFDELADVLNAEQQLLKALPRMAKAAQSEELRQAFETHRDETEGQVSRIEEVARSLGESLKRKKCKGMEGLLEEGKEIMEEKEDSPALDAALIASAQKVEHYEIASYGTLCAWAKLLEEREALELLQQNLSEEEATDEKLSQIAETVANLQGEQVGS